jgi:ABC-type amino acid transport substrate-binding protein
LDPLTLIGTAVAIVGTAGTLVGAYYARRAVSAPAASRTSNPTAPMAAAMPAEPDGLQTIQDAKRLRVGCVQYPPLLGYHYERNKLVVEGLYYELVQRVAQAHSLSLEFTPVSWHNLQASLEGKKLDLLLCVFDTPERRHFSTPGGALHKIRVGAVAIRKKGRVWTEGDLRDPDVRLAVTEGEVGWEFAREILDFDTCGHRITFVKDTAITTMMDLVRTEKVDIALADALSCAAYCQQHSRPGKVLYDPFESNSLHECDNGFVVRRGEQRLAAWLTEEFRKARKDPGIRALEEAFLKEYGKIASRVAL